MSTFEHHINQFDSRRVPVERPKFSSQITTDRLREGERRPSNTQPVKRMKPHRRSIFREEGLDDLSRTVYHNRNTQYTAPTISETHESKHTNDTFDGILKDYPHNGTEDASKKAGNAAWLAKLTKGTRPQIKASASAPPGSFSTISRSVMIVFLIALVVPGFRYSNGKEKVNISGADAGVIRSPQLVENASTIEGRQDNPTDICTRWSHQMANVNGTVYIYGGQAKTESGQTSNYWNNNFLTLDLTKTWQITSPVMSGLPQPSGPPAVAMGALWNSNDALWLYGGMFSDNPSTSPLPVSTWKYDIASKDWTEFQNPQTTQGNFSDNGNKPVQRSAEGASLSVPEIGRSWYFGGHLDLYTTEGWSNQIARVYLKSFLEFTHPGYANTGVASLRSDKGAGKEGVYRNITDGGLQDEAGFTERADGALVYIPGWGSEGIILGLAGGTNETFTEMNIIDIYDIANSTWYKQPTTGKSPPIRVNPCTSVAMAPDGSSFNVYLYGGQNLIPYGSQTQYSDMWILTIPSFTWIEVDLEGQSAPPARAGHSCTMWDGQMVVVGGYVGKDISCDSPGIYVFNASSLKWSNTFTSLSSSEDNSDSADKPDSSGSGSGSGSGSVDTGDSSIVRGSVGYQVPESVQSVIGGSALGGATATQPASGPATDGPIATGKPPTYTITQSGSIVTQTSAPTSEPQDQKKETNVGAIAAGSVAGVLAILAAYLAFCSWLYRRQLKMYKNHVAMAQRTSFNASPDPGWSGSATGSAGRNSEKPVPVLGPFGTEIGATAGRASLGAHSSHSGPAGLTRPTSNNITPGSRPSADDSGYGGGGGVYGGGLMPGRGYGKMSNPDESPEYIGSVGRPSGSTANSSAEDLLGGQEPSFFAVVMNPRRTLRVVNSD